MVQPGDVVGWYIPFTVTVPPLSPLFRARASSDREDVVVDMRYRAVTQEDCVICGSSESAGDDFEVVYDTVALVAPTLSKCVCVCITTGVGSMLCMGVYNYCGCHTG